jgi:hypothetical protein
MTMPIEAECAWISTSGTVILSLRSGLSPRWRGVFVGAEIVPGPAVERPVAHARHEIGHEIVAEIVALVGRAPEVAVLRVHGKAHTVAQPAGEYAPIAALGIEHEHGRAVGLVAPGAAQAMLRFPPRDRRGVALSHPLTSV